MRFVSVCGDGTWRDTTGILAVCYKQLGINIIIPGLQGLNTIFNTLSFSFELQIDFIAMAIAKANSCELKCRSSLSKDPIPLIIFSSICSSSHYLFMLRFVQFRAPHVLVADRRFTVRLCTINTARWPQKETIPLGLATGPEWDHDGPRISMEPSVSQLRG